MAELQTFDGSVPQNLSAFGGTSYGVDSGILSRAAATGADSPDSVNAFFSRLFDPSGYNETYNQLQDAKANAFTAEQNALDRYFNSIEAQKNRDWQTEMSNTAYQRAMADMQAAGLNPILAYQQGGASTGSSSAASHSGSGSGKSTSINVGNSRDNIKELFSMAGSAMKLFAGLI